MASDNSHISKHAYYCHIITFTEIDKIYWNANSDRKNVPSRLTLPPPWKSKTFHFYTVKYDGIVNSYLFSFIITEIFAQMSIRVKLSNAYYYKVKR